MGHHPHQPTHASTLGTGACGGGRPRPTGRAHSADRPRRRPIGPGSPLRWSARWWESAEAITRLDAIWRAWETLRLDPGTGLSVWLKDHADYHLAILMSPTGPFRNSEDLAKITEPLPYEPPPAGLFTAVL